MATGLAGSKSGYHFVLWNTKPDGTGTDLTKYGPVTGPVTFYAVYYQSDYHYTGAPQTFTAPVDGVYRITCKGASAGRGGNPANPGQGGISWADVSLKAGQKLYVYVGGMGSVRWGGWNGGGSCYNGYHLEVGGGGGATDVRLNSELRSRIIVAGGGGGVANTCCDDGPGGNGGGLVGGTGYGSNKAYGGTQNAGGTHEIADDRKNPRGSFGQGGNPYSCGGAGGGGWYGGCSSWYGSGGGGSSYILDYPGCDRTYASYQHACLPSLKIGSACGAGSSWNIAQGGNVGHGSASIVLTKRAS